MTVQPGALPDPGLIFDCLFARTSFKKHPNNVSSILFYWASLIIHDLFQTNHRDFSISETSSYLDLSPLYGDTQEDQDQIRTFKDGKLKPDCFSEQRMLGFPPGTGISERESQDESSNSTFQAVASSSSCSIASTTTSSTNSP